MMKEDIQHEALVVEQEEAQETGVSLDELLNDSNVRSQMNPLHGVYTLPLFFDEEHQIFCIQHPYREDYAIPVERTTVPISMNDAGKEVLIAFNGGDIYQPIITGKVRALTPEVGEVDMSQEQAVSVGLDNQEKLVFKADKEIILQCGKSSIHLTRAGKVLIRGEYILSRSSGVNKIRGGSVQLN
ncbi:MAG: DUF6484 domain-containing protein [Gammaproteobacteria bacterium]|nr:DUF6484 domain-containing protein [Gammaproteobacteria bacterium]